MLDWLDDATLERDALYLGVLTARGVKPLSRLEHPIRVELRRLLVGLGLQLMPIRRLTLSGGPVEHLVLSADPARLEAYRAEFDGTPLADEAPALIRSQARHFGYPACCAEWFIERGYAPNGLDPADQRMLFHRACAGCVETARRLPAYRAALGEAGRLYTLIARHQARSSSGCCASSPRGRRK